MKRATHSSLYLDTLNITWLEKSNKLLLRAAVWRNQDGELTLVSKDSLPDLRDTGGVVFIMSEKDCDWLKGLDIKCPVKGNEESVGMRAATPLDSPKIQAAVGAGAAILLIVIILVIVYCCRRKRKQNKKVLYCETSPTMRDDQLTAAFQFQKCCI